MSLIERLDMIDRMQADLHSLKTLVFWISMWAVSATLGIAYLFGKGRK